MNRNEMLKRINTEEEWDIIIIGGGATGLGTAVDAASRGFKTLLLEQHDFAKGTSSRSTKLVHGGVRYLAQGNIKLVRESLKERGLLLKNAPHVCSSLSFVLPCYSLWQKIYYGTGLKLYDLMSGKLSLGPTRVISSKKAKFLLPAINSEKLSGAVIYQDGQFDDARLAINLAQTIADNGGTALNYCKVTGLVKQDTKITGVKLVDEIEHRQFEIKCKVVINAAGIFTDEVLKMDDAASKNIILPSQGIHLVFNKKYFPGTSAMIIPKTADGRVLFALPWQNRVIAGTTDTPVKTISSEPLPLQDEIEFILEHMNRYLVVNLERSAVLSAFAGLRPLVIKNKIQKPSLMSRSHTIIVSKSGLVTITGGKWTTYRKMGEDAVNNAIFSGKLEKKASVTGTLKIHGWKKDAGTNDPLHIYGSDAALIKGFCKENEEWNQLIHPAFPNIKAEVIWAVRNEMAMTVEDMLARRMRILFLDAQAAIDCAPVVARLMADEMNKEDNWLQEQINSFTELAKQYLLLS